MSAQPDHRLILRHCGIVFLLIGLFDIGLFVYCVMHSIPFSSSLNMVGLIGGCLLIRGNLGAAAFMQWISWFLAALMIGWMVVLPGLVPLDLVWVLGQLYPTAMSASLVLTLILTATFLRLAIRLGSAPVALARSAVGRRPIKVVIPIIVGVLLPLFASVLVVKLQSSAIGQRAVAEARKVQGDEYRYFLSQIHCHWDSQEARYAAIVTAWNDQEIIPCQVSWTENR